MTDEAPDFGNMIDGPVSQPPAPRGRRLWTWLPWVLVGALTASTTWLAVRSGSRPAEPSPQPAQPPTTPVAAAPVPKPGPLEPWPEGQSAAELLGYNNARAYRWSGGILTGWVEFDDGPKPRRVAIDLSETVAKGWNEDPSHVFGQIIIARRPAAKDKTEQECWVWVRVARDVVGPEFKGREARSTAYHGRWRPRGEIEGVFASNRTVTLHTGPQGEPFFPDKGLKWLELRVETTPRKE